MRAVDGRRAGLAAGRVGFAAGRGTSGPRRGTGGYRRGTVGHRMADGMLAGLAGSAALNAVTYLDMAVRARPSSGTPTAAVERLADKTGVSLGDPQQAGNRRSGLGPLLGYLAGVGTATVWAVLAGRRRTRTPIAAPLLAAAAMVAADGPLAALRVTDPRTWSAVDWLSDLVPHLVYGAVVATTLDRLRPR